MKQLNTGGGNADWGSKIIKDLAFIKKKKRYPLTARAIAPLSSLLLLSILYGSFIQKWYATADWHLNDCADINNSHNSNIQYQANFQL